MPLCDLQVQGKPIPLNQTSVICVPGLHPHPARLPRVVFLSGLPSSQPLPLTARLPCMSSDLPQTPPFVLAFPDARGGGCPSLGLPDQRWNELVLDSSTGYLTNEPP